MTVLIFVVAGEADKVLKMFASACHIGGPNFVNPGKSQLLPRFVAWQRKEKMEGYFFYGDNFSEDNFS